MENIPQKSKYRNVRTNGFASGREAKRAFELQLLEKASHPDPGGGMKHDASRNRQDAKSERIRLAHGWLTPAEQQEQAEAEERRRLEQAKKAAQGPALFEES
jgi:hypothetical protein